MPPLFRVAALLLWLTADTPTGPEIPDPSPQAWAALKAFAVSHDLAGPEDFKAGWTVECQWLRWKWRCCVDAPPSCDVESLPPAEVVREWQGVVGRLREDIVREASACPWKRESLSVLLVDLDQRHAALQLILDARQGRYAADRRECLKRLRKALGPDDYYAGRWPIGLP